jgi:hypothetical protein
MKLRAIFREEGRDLRRRVEDTIAGQLGRQDVLFQRYLESLQSGMPCDFNAENVDDVFARDELPTPSKPKADGLNTDFDKHALELPLLDELNAKIKCSNKARLDKATKFASTESNGTSYFVSEPNGSSMFASEDH